MKKQRFTQEQIIAVLKEQEAGPKVTTSAASRESQKKRFIIGKPNTAAWKPPKRSV